MSAPLPISNELAACFEQGLARLDAQDWASARDHFCRGLEIDPSRLGLWLNRAWCHIHLGDLPSAQTDLQALLRLQPGHAAGLALLGRVCLALGSLREGAEWLERAWMADPQDPDIARQALMALLLRPETESASVQRAKALARVGQLDRDSAHRLQEVLGSTDAGRKSLRQLWAQLCTEIQAEPWMFEAWSRLCWETREVDEAALAATLWLRCAPGDEAVMQAALQALMRALTSRGDSDTVIPLATQRVLAHPRDIAAMLELVGCLLEAPRDDHREAGLTVLAHALSLAPEDPRPWLLRGQHHAKVFLHEQALGDFRRALDLAPQLVAAQAGLVRSLAALGRSAEASRALEAMPVLDASSWMERQTASAFMLRTQGRIREAQVFLQDCVARGGGAAPEWELGGVLLTQGRYEQGWALWRGLQQEHGPRPLWHRLATRGARPWPGDVAQARGRTLAVVSETGLGDALQFARFLPPLQAQGVQVLLYVQPGLAPLLRLTQPALKVFDDIDLIPQADWVCALWDLPMLLDVRLATLDRWGPAHYLDPAPGERMALARRLGPRRGLRIALAWRGQRSPLAERSIGLESIAALQRPGLEWFSLQRELLPGVESEAAERLNLRHEGWCLQEAALALGHMDLVVSIDTVFCHLAGSLGVPVQVLLPLACDWRWGTDEHATPWYPRATLHRQQRAGDWTEPLASLAEVIRMRQAGLGASALGGAL